MSKKVKVAFSIIFIFFIFFIFIYSCNTIKTKSNIDNIPPSEVTNLNATASDKKVTLSWTEP